MNFCNNHRASRNSGSPAQRLAGLSHGRKRHRTGSIRLGCQERLTSNGFTLVELMVAMTIGLIILAAVAKIFATSRSTYVLEEGIARVQEAGRFGTEFITTDVRMAGYLGCANSKTTTVQNHLNNPTSYGTNYAPGQYISGHTYTGTGARPAPLNDWTPPLPGSVSGVTYFSSGDVEPYTDVLVIRRASETGIKLGEPMPDTSADLKIDANPGGLVNKDIVMISDCSNADIFQITGPASMSAGTNNLVHNTGGSDPGNLTKPLSKTYGSDAEIMKLVTRIYYIGRRANNTNNPPALFRKELGTSASISTQELIEGVERMKVVYGVDTEATSDSTANIYQLANVVDAASNWSKVVSVRIGLLVRTPSNVDQTADTRTYIIAGQNVTPATDPDPLMTNALLFRRQIYNTTIQLRN